MPHSSEEVRPRARDLGLIIGRFPPGPLNAITDVEGVQVGHSTIVRGKGRLRVGKGPVRTGVTAILPNAGNIFYQRVHGGAFVLNGAGEVSGLTQVSEWGLIETPLMLTNTLSVGACSEAVVQYMVSRYPGIGKEHDVIIPLVGECDDSWLNDVGGRHVRREHVYEAIETAAGGPVPEGNVGGGTGMITCDLKGGIGTASRRLPKEMGGYTVGVLVQSNFGRLEDLRMDGIPIGLMLAPEMTHHQRREGTAGSIIAVAGTDAPLLPHQLNRLAKRVALGIGRVGSFAAHGSGEIIITFSNANTVPRRTKRRVYRVSVLLDARMDPLYEASVDATEEAILNAICAGRTMEGLNMRRIPALPVETTRRLIEHYGYEVPLEPRRRKTTRDQTGPIEQVGGDRTTLR